MPFMDLRFGRMINVTGKITSIIFDRGKGSVPNYADIVSISRELRFQLWKEIKHKVIDVVWVSIHYD